MNEKLKVGQKNFTLPCLTICNIIMRFSYAIKMLLLGERGRQASGRSQQRPRQVRVAAGQQAQGVRSSCGKGSTMSLLLYRVKIAY